MASLLQVIPAPARVADGYKFAVSGGLIGVVLSGASEAAGDMLVKLAGIKEDGELVHVGANLLIRLSVATGAFLIADRMQRAIGSQAQDPTGGLFFHAAFLFGQKPLVSAFGRLSNGIAQQTKELAGLSCCDSCAENGPCAGDAQ